MNMARITAGCCDAGFSPLARTLRVTCGVDGNGQILAGDWPGILVENDVPKPFVFKLSEQLEIAYGADFPSETTSLGQTPVRAGGRFMVGAEANYEIERYYVHSNGTHIARVTAKCIDGCRDEEALVLFCVIDEKGRVAYGDWMGYEENGEQQLPFVLCNRSEAVFQYRNVAAQTTFRSSLVGNRFDVSFVRTPGSEVRHFEVMSCELL
jgi:hypothetical protein